MCFSDTKHRTVECIITIMTNSEHLLLIMTLFTFPPFPLSSYCFQNALQAMHYVLTHTSTNINLHCFYEFYGFIALLSQLN